MSEELRPFTSSRSPDCATVVDCMVEAAHDYAVSFVVVSGGAAHSPMSQMHELERSVVVCRPDASLVSVEYVGA